MKDTLKCRASTPCMRVFALCCRPVSDTIVFQHAFTIRNIICTLHAAFNTPNVSQLNLTRHTSGFRLLRLGSQRVFNCYRLFSSTGMNGIKFNKRIQRPKTCGCAMWSVIALVSHEISFWLNEPFTNWLSYFVRFGSVNPWCRNHTLKPQGLHAEVVEHS